MKNKITVLVIVVAVIATGAMGIAIAWLGTSLPSAINAPGYEHGNPYEPINRPSDHPISPEEPDNLSHDRPNHDSRYGLPQGDDYSPYQPYPYAPHTEDYENDYIFTPIFTRKPLPEHIIQFITGVTFHDTTPFGYDYLTYLTITHVNFYGESIIGHLIVADWIGDEVLDIFHEMYEGGFPIHSVKLIDHFNASDYYSMAANNSHAFNFRYIAGTNVVSRHGFGVAIDINPIQNPYIRGNTIWPAAGAAYLDRTYVRPGMIVPGSVAYNAFINRGWIWGGYWTSPRDYHHFERRR